MKPQPLQKGWIKQYDKRHDVTYVYKNIAYWDKEKQQSRAKREIVGRLDPETNLVVPTRNQIKENENAKHKDKKLNKQEEILQFNQRFERFHFGVAYALRKIARKTRLLQNLKEVFGKERADQILSLAQYLILSPNNSMMHYPQWSQRQWTYTNELSSQAISRLFQSITEDDKQKFFQLNLSQHPKDRYWAYDTTSISSYSQQLSYAQYGYNKEGDNLAQINLALLYSEKEKLPLAYRQLYGNTPDVSTIPWLLEQLRYMGAESVCLILDRGHYSYDNVKMFLQESQAFILGGRVGIKYIQEAIQSLEDPIQSFINYDPSTKLYHKKVTLSKEFKASANSYYPTYLHIYYDELQAGEDRIRFDHQLQEYYEELQSGKLKKTHEQAYKRYFSQNPEGELTMNQDEIRKAQNNFGYFVLLTSEKELTSLEVLALYRNKDVIEKSFNDLKDRLNMRRLRVHSDVSLEGKLFVQFIALYLVSYVKAQMDACELFETYTLMSFMGTLNQFECYVDPSGEVFYGELSEKIKDLMCSLKVPIPE